MFVTSLDDPGICMTSTADQHTNNYACDKKAV